MNLLREFIRELLIGEQYPYIPPHPDLSRETLIELIKVKQQYNNPMIPEALQDLADEDMLQLFENYLTFHGLSFNRSYFEKIKDEVSPTIGELKDFYNRRRPAEIAKLYGIECGDGELTSAQSPSYPSGHTIQSHLIALLLGEQYPQHAASILQIAELISQSRLDRGVHFPSDISFGKQIAHIIFERIKD